jgi:hypothetical protein
MGEYGGIPKRIIDSLHPVLHIKQIGIKTPINIYLPITELHYNDTYELQ